LRAIASTLRSLCGTRAGGVLVATPATALAMVLDELEI
jgi:hypothetical protein